MNVILTRLVNHMNETIGFCVRVIDHRVDLSDFKRRS